MKPSRCSNCGKAEWRHVCIGSPESSRAVDLATVDTGVAPAAVAVPERVLRAGGSGKSVKRAGGPGNGSLGSAVAGDRDLGDTGVAGVLYIHDWSDAVKRGMAEMAHTVMHGVTHTSDRCDAQPDTVMHGVMHKPMTAAERQARRRAKLGDAYRLANKLRMRYVRICA